VRIGAAHIRDAATGNEIRELFTSIIYSAAFSPDGTRIVTASSVNKLI
jgi:WD40 repeat protein